MSWNFLVILKSAVANPLVSSVETFNELRETKQVAKKKELLSKKVVVSSSVSSYCFSGLLPHCCFFHDCNFGHSIGY